MAFGRAPATIEEVRDPDRIKRYTLVPRSSVGTNPDGVKRFTLARVGASPRSALGADRLERMEQIAEAEREQQSRNGGDPARQERFGDEAGDQAAE
jgi:hypothetical protein